MASVSHELRTPLTAIVGYAELLEARWGSFCDETRRDHVRRIVQSAHRQQRLVEDLLLVSRLDMEMFSVECRTVDLEAHLLQAVTEVRGSYPGQHIKIGGPGGVMVLADPVRLVQVLVNLIDNAAKYSPEGTSTEVHWQVDGSLVTVRIRDHGPGIPDGHRHHLFKRFGRIPGSRIRAGHVGTGLGLFLGRQLARAMGGGLDLELSGPQGSTFRLQLPLAESAVTTAGGAGGCPDALDATHLVDG